MTGDHDRDHRIREWLIGEAPADVPDVVLRTALDRARATRRPHLLSRTRFSPMNRLLPVGLAAGIVTIAVVALLPRGEAPGVGAGTAASPSSMTAPPATPAATPSPTSSPSLEPLNVDGQLAYVAESGGNDDIYVANLDRSGVVRLTSDPARDSMPAWVPDGSGLVFSRGTDSNSDLWAMDADGGNQRQLTSASGAEAEPAVSPDGTRIAYTTASGAPSIRVMNADGTGDIEVLAGPAFVGSPRWTEGGAALLVNVDTSSGGQITVSRLDLETMDLTTVIGGGGDNSGNAISPDGSKIVFQGDRRPGGLFTADIDGSGIAHLVGSSQDGYAASWSPDGSWILYQAPGGSNLFIVPSDGGDPVLWGPGQQPASRPNMAP